jgi:osmoprotectant transport system permease protein
VLHDVERLPAGLAENVVARLKVLSGLLTYRLDVPQRFPKAWAALAKLEAAIDEQRMIAMNAAAELDAKPFSAVAAEFLAGEGARPAVARQGLAARLFGPDLWKLTWQHLMLVFVSLAFAVAVGVPLGIWAARSSGAAQPVLSAVGLIQTVPSLALLAFLIPLLGTIGTLPALVALFLYSLLPIVRNTHSGLATSPRIRESDVPGCRPARSLDRAAARFPPPSSPGSRPRR